MTPQQLKRSYELFVGALERPKEGRNSFLENECGTDRELHAYVKALLKQEEAAPDDDPLSIAPSPLRRDDRLGASVGPYVLRDRLGEGGYGVVYLATRHEEFKQRVAVKVLKRGVDTEEVVARFRAERQRLAALTHENIARLLDGGDTNDGVPYFAMEYIKGESITAFCEHKRLPPHGILELFQKVCSAVSYVHGFGLIHRDLKPGNILVTADGTPKILDFGIAKALSSELSNVGSTTFDSRSRCLSPRYGSPEQMRGEHILTVKTDVYSLGVILYELLSGKSPYGKLRTVEEIKARATEGSLPEPSKNCDLSRRRQIDRELDTLCLKALEREPENRYSSVQELSNDIQRYIDDIPIHARPHGPVYRAVKFVRRNRVSVLAACVVFVALLTGLVISTVSLRLYKEQQEVALEDLRTARNVIDGLLYWQFKDVTGDPDSAIRRKVVEQAQHYYQSVVHKKRGIPQYRNDVGTCLFFLGIIKWIGSEDNPGTVLEEDRGEQEQRSSIAIFDELIAENPERPQYLHGRARATAGLGICFVNKDSAYSMRLFEEALRDLKRLVSDHADADFLRDLAWCEYFRASFAQNRLVKGSDPSEFAVTAGMWEECVRSFDALAQQDPHYRETLLYVVDECAQVHKSFTGVSQGFFGKCLEYSERGLVLIKSFGDYGPEKAANLKKHELSCFSLKRESLSALGRHDEAILACRKLLDEGPAKQPFANIEYMKSLVDAHKYEPAGVQTMLVPIDSLDKNSLYEFADYLSAVAGVVQTSANAVELSPEDLEAHPDLKELAEAIPIGKHGEVRTRFVEGAIRCLRRSVDLGFMAADELLRRIKAEEFKGVSNHPSFSTFGKELEARRLQTPKSVRNE